MHIHPERVTRKQVPDLHSETEVGRKEAQTENTHAHPHTHRYTDEHTERKYTQNRKYIEMPAEESPEIIRHKHPERAFTDTHANSKHGGTQT